MGYALNIKCCFSRIRRLSFLALLLVLHFNCSILYCLWQRSSGGVIGVCAISLAESGMQSSTDITNGSPSHKEMYETAMKAVNNNDYHTAIEYLEILIQGDEDNIDLTQLLGTLYLQCNESVKAVPYLEKALKLDDWREPAIIANLIEALRRSKQVTQAIEVGQKAVSTLQHRSAPIYFNLACALQDKRDDTNYINALSNAINIDPSYEDAWARILEYLSKTKQFQTLERVALQSIQHFPQSSKFYYMLGVARHHMNHFEGALDAYNSALQFDPKSYVVISNIAAALQSLGRASEALIFYEKLIPFEPNDAGIRNNYGALLGIMGRKDEEIYWLKQALQIEPDMENALINAAGYMQDEGLLVEAAQFLDKVLPLSEKPNLVRLRSALLMSPVHSSWKEMIDERNIILDRLNALIEKVRRDNAATQDMKKNNSTVQSVDSTLDRIHFYVAYHGLNDRYFQERVVEAYRLMIDDFEYYSPEIRATDPSLMSFKHEILQDAEKTTHSDKVSQTTQQIPATISVNKSKVAIAGPLKRKIRVGFLSKFFGIFEPHGLLLDGVMTYLPRDIFEVIALPVARTDGKPLEPTIKAACEEVHEISLSQEYARLQIAKHNIDILVFADTMSEPMAHYLAHHRLARVQIAFWGNPITSASKNIDYFISADGMEHPFRTRMSSMDEPYAEQVVLIEGQGIWYFRPPSTVEDYLAKANLLSQIKPLANQPTRETFGYDPDWFIYFCPQSVFKIHPLFDQVFFEILKRNPLAHLVVTGGRRERWTRIYKERIERMLGPEMAPRFHIIDRVSSEQFLPLLKIANVVLHPFPFDGSRTSADGLYVGIPTVTLPTEYLRGRMGASLLKTMGVHELVARNKSEYIDIATKLCTDKNFYNRMKQLVEQRVDLIWEDMSYPFEWTIFLTKIAGLKPPSWQDFIAQSGRSIQKESELFHIRKTNRMLFDEKWGKESWLLSGGKAILETHLLNSSYQPRIFNDWKSDIPSSDYGASFHGIFDQPQENHEQQQRQQQQQQQREGQHPPSKVSTINLRRFGSIKPDQSIESSSSLSPTGTAASAESSSMLNEDVETRRRMYELTLTRRVDESYALALSILHRHQSNPSFLLDLGVIQYYRGEYNDAQMYCRRALELVPRSKLAYGCIGVSYTYLNEQDKAIEALSKSWQLRNVKPQEDIFSEIFSLTTPIIEQNLISTLKTFGRYQECVDSANTIAGLPPPSVGGAFIFVMSFVQWSPSRIPMIEQLEKFLRDRGLFSLPSDKTLMGEISRMQQYYSHLLNPAMECYMVTISPTLKKTVLDSLMDVVNINDKDLVLNINDDNHFSDISLVNVISSGPLRLPLPLKTDTRPILLTQYFRSQDNTIQADVNFALQRNLNNCFIAKIVLINEEEYDFSSFENNHKIIQLVIGHRLTFEEAFRFSNEYLNGYTVILANADIFFDKTLQRLTRSKTETASLLGRRVMSLLKWKLHIPNLEVRQKISSSEEEIESLLTLEIRSDSQDTWIFQPPLNESMFSLSNFHLGTVRCDNRIAEILSTSGHAVYNPAFSIRTIEISSNRKEGIYSTKGSAFGDTRDILIADSLA